MPDDEEEGEDRLMDVAETETEADCDQTSAGAAAATTPVAIHEQFEMTAMTSTDTCPQCRPSSGGNKTSFLTFDELMTDVDVSVHQHQLWKIAFNMSQSRLRSMEKKKKKLIILFY